MLVFATGVVSVFLAYLVWAAFGLRRTKDHLRREFAARGWSNDLSEVLIDRFWDEVCQAHTKGYHPKAIAAAIELAAIAVAEKANKPTDLPLDIAAKAIVRSTLGLDRSKD